MTPLPAHALKLVLVEPEIPQNAGNIARLCAATNVQLHLVRPLGFFLTDKHLKRAGMDYLDLAAITTHDSLPDLLAVAAADPLVMTSGLRGDAPWSVAIPPNAWIFFGKESAGLPDSLLHHPAAALVRIPLAPGIRGLNLSTAAGIIVYEAIRQRLAVPTA